MNLLRTQNPIVRFATSAILGCLVLIMIGQVAGAQDFQPLNNNGTMPSNGFEIPSSPTVSSGTVGEGEGMILTDQPVEESASVTAAANDLNVLSATRLTDVVRRGGMLMIPIGICSFILVVFVFERLVSLRKARIIPGPFTKRFLEQLRDGDLNRESAITLCERNNSPVSNVFKAGVMKWGRPSVEVEQAVLDEGERTSNQLRKYLRLINGVATVCPLLGLLGTVLGMIHAFDSLATVQAGPNPESIIATGISQALLTTAAGLTVAIPALIAYLFFSSRADKHVMEIDSLGMKIVNLVSAESISSNRKTKTTRKAA